MVAAVFPFDLPFLHLLLAGANMDFISTTEEGTLHTDSTSRTQRRKLNHGLHCKRYDCHDYDSYGYHQDTFGITDRSGG